MAAAKPQTPPADEVSTQTSIELAQQLAAELAAPPAPLAEPAVVQVTPVPPALELGPDVVHLVNDTNPEAAGWYDPKVAAVLLADDDALGWRRADPDEPAVPADAPNPDGGDAGEPKE